jgi:predicted alpha/beta hydrolase family esterase
MVPFAFRSLVVASTNDPFGSLAHAKHCATAWGSTFVDIGPAGHINADSGHGEWSEGYTLLADFISLLLTDAPSY